MPYPDSEFRKRDKAPIAKSNRNGLDGNLFLSRRLVET